MFTLPKTSLNERLGIQRLDSTRGARTLTEQVQAASAAVLNWPEDEIRSIKFYEIFCGELEIDEDGCLAGARYEQLPAVKVLDFEQDLTVIILVPDLDALAIHYRRMDIAHYRLISSVELWRLFKGKATVPDRRWDKLFEALEVFTS